jgi:hypothetical protein
VEEFSKVGDEARWGARGYSVSTSISYVFLTQYKGHLYVRSGTIIRVHTVENTERTIRSVC